jgi:hypothetical protein
MMVESCLAFYVAPGPQRAITCGPDSPTLWVKRKIASLGKWDRSWKVVNITESVCHVPQPDLKCVAVVEGQAVVPACNEPLMVLSLGPLEAQASCRVVVELSRRHLEASVVLVAEFVDLVSIDLERWPIRLPESNSRLNVNPDAQGATVTGLG